MRLQSLLSGIALLIAASLKLMGEDDFVRIPRSEYEQLKSQAAKVEKLEQKLRELGVVTPETRVNPVVAQKESLEKLPSASLADSERQLKAREAELTAAKNEIERLKKEHARMAVDPHPINPMVLKSLENLPPARPLTGLKPVEKDETVPVHELLAHYAADPKAADARYLKKAFRLQGIVADVDKPLVGSSFVLFFRIPNYDGQVMCEAYPPEKYSRVYATSDRLRVLGVVPGHYPTTLASVGSEMNFIVRCLGIKSGGVRVDTVMLGQ